jgi:hypothetical protein
LILVLGIVAHCGRCDFDGFGPGIVGQCECEI